MCCLALGVGTAPTLCWAILSYGLVSGNWQFLNILDIFLFGKNFPNFLNKSQQCPENPEPDLLYAFAVIKPSKVIVPTNSSINLLLFYLWCVFCVFYCVLYYHDIS